MVLVTHCQLFIKQLDERELAREKKARRLKKQAKEKPIFPQDKQKCRWSHFNKLAADMMFTTVRDDAFPFIKTLGGTLENNAYSRHMKVIVPDGVLFGSSKAHKDIRKMLVEEHKLDGVISMPSGVFKPYAGVSTAILMFTKTGAGGTDFVWFCDMQADGFSLDDKRQPVEENDIPNIIKSWQKRNPKKDNNRNSKAFFVPKDEIKDNGYDLSINRYKEVEYEEIEYEHPLVILGKLRELEGEINQDLDESETLLNGD
ncbi:MAG: N-6 DNA methylase [Trichodesmium sp. MO_231.B1]|nr:N-6 DNA methylase [Trichodesmium sp. MO_231.B1]